MADFFQLERAKLKAEAAKLELDYARRALDRIERAGAVAVQEEDLDNARHEVAMKSVGQKLALLKVRQLVGDGE